MFGSQSILKIEDSADRTAAGLVLDDDVADFTIRHPENDQAELLWHCGSFPVGIAKKSFMPK
jgi:hypothetical protein